MRASTIALWLVATGCDRFLGLDPTHPLDAACALPDEDGDCIADPVDNCPGLANADQADDDMDGVGNVCDPDPNSQQVRLAFSPFTGADLSFWQPTSSAWTIDATAGLVRHAMTSDATLFSQANIDDVDDLTVEATFIYHRNAATPPNRLGVWVDTPQGQANGQACWIDAANKMALAEESITDTTHGNTTAVS